MSVARGLNWRLGFAVLGVVYTAWVIYLGLDNFAKVHGEYRRALEQQQPDRLAWIARQELVDQCRRQAKSAPRAMHQANTPAVVSEDRCVSFPSAVLEARKKVVAENLRGDEKRFFRKIVVFYLTFAIFFLGLPLTFLYLLLAFLIWVFRDMKFVK